MDVTPLKSESLFHAWMARVPESRQEKVKAFTHEEGKLLSLGVGILLYRALEERGIDGSHARIMTGEFGKPYLLDYPEIQFSLSHADPWAMCAISDVTVGCDVERMNRVNEKLAKRLLHPSEAAELPGQKDSKAWDELFTLIWTRKESYVKATGQGLSLPLQSFDCLHPTEGVRYTERNLVKGYSFACCALSRESIQFEWRMDEQSI